MGARERSSTGVKLSWVLCAGILLVAGPAIASGPTALATPSARPAPEALPLQDPAPAATPAGDSSEAIWRKKTATDNSTWKKPGGKTSASKAKSPKAKSPKPKSKPSKNATSKSSAAAPIIPPPLQEIEKRYAEAGSLRADYSQLTVVAAMNQEKTSSGTLLLKHPGKVRWEQLKPDRSLTIGDGKKIWFYTPPFDESEPGQVLIRSAAEVQSRLANALLSGNFSGATGLEITQDSPIYFTLFPRRGTAGTVEKAQVRLSKDGQFIEKVVLHNLGGNRSEITLSEIKLGEPAPDSLFVFEQPPNTEVVSD